MATNETAGPLQAALDNMNKLRSQRNRTDSEVILFDAVAAALTALIPATQLAIDTSQRAIAADRDIGVLAERLQGAEHRLDEHTTQVAALERDVSQLTHRDQLAFGKVDGLRSRLERTVTDLRSAEAAIGELHERLEDAVPGTAIPARALEQIRALRAQIGVLRERNAQQAAAGMDTSAAEAIAREAARAWARTNRAAIERGEMRYLADVEDTNWRPHAWVIDAVMAAAGAHPDIESPGQQVERLRDILADIANVLRVNGAEPMTWREIPSVVAKLYMVLANVRSAREHLLQTSNADMERVSGERDRAEAGRDTFKNALERVEDALDEARVKLDAERRKVMERDAEVHQWIDHKAATQAQLDKFMGACADQTIQIMELRGEVKRLTEISDRSKAADMLIAAMPEWAANVGTPLRYETPLLRVWGEVEQLVTPAEPPESDAETIEPLSGL